MVTEQEHRSLAEQNQWFRRLLTRCLPIVQADAQMMADLSRFAPLTHEEQRKHDTTEQDSERLVHDIPEALNSKLPGPGVETPISLVEKYSGIYNACDRTGCRRGVPAKGQPAPARVYSVYAIEDVKGVTFALTQSWDIFGKLYEERYPLHTLVAFGPKSRET